MQNRTELVGAPLFHRLRQTLRNNRELLHMAAAGLLACVMAGSRILESVSPFGVSCAAAAGGPFSLPAALGAAAGYILAPQRENNLKYLAAVLLVLALRWALSSGKVLRAPLLLPPLAAGGALAAPALIVAMASGGRLDDLILALSEIFLAAGGAYFFARAAQALSLGLENAGPHDGVCLMVTLGLAVLSLSRVQCFGLSVGRVFAMTAVLLCAAGAGEAAGAIGGIGAGLASALVSSKYSHLMGAYGLAGLTAGFFSRSGRLAAALSFLSVSTLTAIFSPTHRQMLQSIEEAAAAAGIFLLLPQGALSLGRFSGMRPVSADRDELVRHLLFSRLTMAADGLTDICTATKKVTSQLDRLSAADSSSVYSHLAESVCRRCSHRTRCWQLEYDKTMDALNSAMLVLRRQQSITREELPQQFQRGCCRLEPFTEALNREYAEYLRQLGTRRKVAQVRSVVTDQFEGMAMMIRELSADLGQITSQDPRSSARVMEYLTGEGLDPLYACCYLGREGHLTAECVIPPRKLARADPAKMALDLSEICERPLGLPAVRTLETRSVLSFGERAVYTLERGAAQIIEEGSRISGDDYCYVDGPGTVTVILSDGMGSGSAAAVDSAMTSGLLSRLLQAGVSYDASLRMVNSALLVKSGEESLATVDVFSLDLHTGKAVFYKAGAAPTFFVRGGRVGYVESTSLPAGILRGVSFEKSMMTFREGDLILMVSDGVTATGVDWLPSQIEACRELPAEELARSLAQTAHDRALPGRDDDVTVVALRVKRA